MKQLLSDAQVELATRLWVEGVPLDELCRSVGCNRDTLVERRCDQRAHLKRRRPGVNSQATRAPDPSPETIAERAAAIRRTQSATEKLNRRSGPGWPVDSQQGERVGGPG